MRSRWTLAVEGLGRIDRAEVEGRPLTLFVGENNSGKSYLASLLWDFHARMPEVFSFHASELAAAMASAQYRACSQWLADKLSRPGSHTLTEADVRLLVTWFNERLREKKDASVQRLFVRPGMTLTDLRVEDVSLDAPFDLIIRQLQQGEAGSSTSARGYEPQKPRTLEIEHVPDVSPSRPSHWTILLTLVAQLLSPDRVRGWLGTEYVQGDPIYLPASRTGFMLLYKGVLSNLIERMAGASGPSGATGPRPTPSVQLTVPAIHFLQLLAFGLKPDIKGPHAAEADLLEREAFPGTVALAGGVGVNEVEYRYDPSAPPLPMQLSSSLVTELAPLVLVLRHTTALPMLFLEEPESHLHPRLVRLVARIIARLVRKGVRVCVTTHSADFCQQINNFIKLGSLPPDERARFQAQYGFDASDYLDESEVAGYQFQIGANGRSNVTRLAESPSGLAMPTFNEELIDLSKQTLDLQRAVEGDA